MNVGGDRYYLRWEPIAAYIAEHGLTQNGFGRKLGVSGPTITFWKTRASSVSRMLRAKIAEVTGIPEADLFEKATA